ncbi:MAG: winged helix-turn-helix domain-containing protein [Acidobacteriota bacterium]|nr:winged helix-turn-helix domain-containing protein [Acidobacteriota bacterium]
MSRRGERVPLADKAFETLCALVKRGNHLVGKDELLAEVWAGAIVEENNLDKNISYLRKVLGEKADKAKFIETVRGHGYRFVAEVREVTEEEKDAQTRGYGDAQTEVLGSKLQVPSQNGNKTEPPAVAGGLNFAESQISDYKFQTSERQRTKGEERRTKDEKTDRSWLIALTFVSIVALGSLGFYLWRGNTKPADAPIKSVAVLPFKPLVAENRDEALEIGMADTLISRLGNNREIVVRPLSSVRKFGKLEQDALTAGRALNVESVLDGSVQRWGDKIRVNVRLVKVADGTSLWTGTFDEEFTDIFVVQDAISNRVAAALALQLGSDEKVRLTKRYTVNVEAYGLYLKGRFHAARLTPLEIQTGISYFQQAIEIDPSYAVAYVGLAEAYRALATAGEMPTTELFPKAKAAAQKAIEIDDRLADAHAILGFIVFWYDWNWKESENQYQRALELNPNSADAHTFYAHLLSNTGHHAEALTEIKRARELDPLNLRTNALEGQFLLHAGRAREALARLQKTFELDPNFWLAHLFASSAYIEKGMFPEAIAEARKARELSGVSTHPIAFESYALAKSGKQAEARGLLAELLKLSTERYVSPYNIASAYNGLDERDETLAWLERGFEQREPKMVFLKVEPKWNNLRSEPRFVALMKRMNFE